MRDSITVKTIKNMITHCTKINHIPTNSETIKISFFSSFFSLYMYVNCIVMSFNGLKQRKS